MAVILRDVRYRAGVSCYARPMECAVLSERMVLCHVSVWGYGMCGTEREYGQVVLNASRVLAKLSLTKVPYPPTGCIRDVRYCRRLCCDPSLSSYAMSGTMYRTLHHCYHDSKLTSYVNMTPIHVHHAQMHHIQPTHTRILSGVS